MAEAKKSRSPFDSQQSYTLHSHHGQKMTFVQSMGKSNISSQNVSNNGKKDGKYVSETIDEPFEIDI